VIPIKFVKNISASAALICLCAGCQSGAPGIGNSASSVHSDAHYAFLFGQRYRTKVDLYVFFFSHDPDNKYVGTRSGDFTFGPKDLPAEITSKNVGLTFANWGPGDLGDIVILDIAPASSVLTIHAETHDVTLLSGIRGSGGYPMGFICQFDYNGKTNFIYSEFIQSHKTVTGKFPNEDISDAVAEKIQ
jgi:hypothetical protein